MSIALACRLALHAADADHEVVVVNSLTGETKKQPYLSINPLGQIPALECDGTVLTQAVAILQFIADRTGMGWAHASDLDRAKALSIMVLTCVEVQSNWTMHNRPERFVDSDQGRAEAVTHALARLDAAYSEIERQLGHLNDDRELGILDYYVGVFALWKSMIPSASGFAPTPRLDAIKERLMSTPKLRAVIDEDIAAYKALAAG